MPIRPANAAPRVWAISDFHWSTHKPMDRHGGVWAGHRERLQVEWRLRVHRHDLVLVPGDITFARDPHADFLDLNRLPGQKVIVAGNHDYWAHGRSRADLLDVLSSHPTLHMLSHDHPTYETGPHLIVGYTGADPPESPIHRRMRHQDAVREAKAVLAHALACRTAGQTVIVVTHYPPSQEELSILAPLEPALWLHGHCHLAGCDRHLVDEWEATRRSPRQLCISSDFLNMIPVDVTGGTIHPDLWPR